MTAATTAPSVAVVTAAGPGGLRELAVLAASVAEHLLGAPVLAVAPTASTPVPGVELLDVEALGAGDLSAAEVHRRAAFSRPDELLASLKPSLLALALARGHDVALWLDPAVEVHGDLSPLITLAVERGTALVPTTTEPAPADGLRLDDASLLTSGLVAPAVVAVAAPGRPLLAWWARRARRDCLLDPPAGLLLDHRWLEAALVLFAAGLLDDRTVGVSYANLHERELRIGPGDGYLVDRSPLRLFDFSGFDPARPWLLSVHQGDTPRVLLSANPALERLAHERADRLAGAATPEERPWPFARSASGRPIDDGQRHLFRRELLAAEAEGADAPPDPFDPEQAGAWERWWAEPVGGTAEHPRNRWGEMLLAERVDLRVSFADADGAAAARFYEWTRNEGVAEGAVPAAFAPEGVGPRHRPAALPGANVVGFLGIDRGVGQAARALADAVAAAGHPLHRLDLPDPGLPPGRRALSVEPGPYDVNLLSVNPNEVVLLARSAAHRPILDGRANVGLWFWEVDRLPDFMRPAFDVVDEVWVASRFNAELFQAWTDVPVEVFPHPVEPARPTELTRDDLGLPPGFLFGFFFDHLSLLERKNPVGLVRAYTRAFSPGDGAVLVLKSINGERRPTDVERLRLAIGDRPDIVVVDRHLSGVEMRAMYAHVDAYVSLHRAEGFGQTMADAMAHAKPVIATGFSANLDYMHADNAYLVSWRPVEVGGGSWPYPADATWAEPDLDEAAAWMRHVFEHPDDAAAKGQRARRDILERHSLARAAAFVERRLQRWW